MTLRIFLFSLLFLTSWKTFSQSLILAGQERIELADHILHYRDTEGDLTLDDIIRKRIPFQSRALNYGFDDAAHWFAFQIDNESKDEDWLLEVAFAPLDKIDFFIRSESGWIEKSAGDLLPMSIRDVRHPHAVFLFSLPQGYTRTIYLRVKTTSSVQVPLILWKRDAFIATSNTVNIINGLFYGAMMIMILYQLFVFLSTHDRITLYYVLTLVAMMHVVAFFQGYSFLYMYPEHPQLNHLMAIVTGPLFLLFSTWLTRAFLDLKKNSPTMDKLLLINMELDILAAIMMIVFFGKISYRFHHYAILLHCVFALIAAGYCLYRNFRPALYYLLSWITLLVATLIFSMSNLGLFPAYLNTSSTGLIIGCLLQMLLISFALGNRWSIMVRENQKSKELEVQRGQLEKERLEQEVQLRLEEINHKNQKLEEVNRIKDKLFSVVSHDIKGPLTSLHLALALTKNETITQKEFQQLTHSLETKFTQTTEFIDNLLQWATLQIRGESFEPVKVNLSVLIQQTIGLLDFELRKKNIEIEDTIDGSWHAKADVNMVKSILRNLLTNAVKFTGNGGHVGIQATANAEFITIAIADTGIGIPKKNQSLIFSLDIVTTPGTGQERGTGLGLLLCKEFVERNNGRIWFETEEGKGTTFYFTLPAYKNDEA
ncbi:MAG TPA: sensor histidine kinase [Ohtaekwangia sp.]|nr:sensor histidine kinase [Ohtaekwangia sp.]